MQKLVELYTRVRVDPSVGTLGYSNDLPSDRVADLQSRIERQERNDQTLEAEAISIIDSAQMSVVHAYHQHQIAPQRAALETLRANLAR
ncbi:MAG: hypothetical protein EOP08_03510 [Proteobacteria bacterium]|nr:MAG: hypothetical protein EOP08_03510 [Pseudomonadota bacterium]